MELINTLNSGPSSFGNKFVTITSWFALCKTIKHYLEKNGRISGTGVP